MFIRDYIPPQTNGGRPCLLKTEPDFLAELACYTAGEMRNRLGAAMIEEAG
jgi:hypothetical protein